MVSKRQQVQERYESMQDDTQIREPSSSLHELDNASFQWFHVKAILISGIGFFTDAYDLFTVSIIAPMIGFSHFPELRGRLPVSVDTAIKGVALCGTLGGQVLFGILGDRSGRKSVYGLTLIVMIVSTILSVATSFGPSQVMVVIFCVWRFILGVGIGGDYPLSAVITSEYSSKNRRGAMLAAVFSMQGLGIVAASVTALVLLRIFKNDIDQCEIDKPCEALDTVWRLCVAFGVIPAAATYWLRKQLPETPRFTHHVKQDTTLASKHIALVMQHSSNPHTHTVQADSYGELHSTDVTASSYGAEGVVGSGGRGGIAEDDNRVIPTVAGPGAMSWREFHNWCMRPANFKVLFGTCSTWFLLDVAFYSNNLFTPTVMADLGYIPELPPASIYTKVQAIASGSALIAMLGSVPGYWAAIALIEVMGRKPMQYMGFAVMTVCMAAFAVLHRSLEGEGKLTWLYITLYVINCFFSNFGPNTTTFIVPGECFPTKYRSTCHGISAACGKAGAVLGAFGIGALYLTRGTAFTFGFLSLFTLGGFVCTWFIPETKGKSLEELGGEDSANPNPEEMSLTRAPLEEVQNDRAVEMQQHSTYTIE